MKTLDMNKLDSRPFQEQLRDAQSFFLTPDLVKELESENPYANKDGLVEFICGTELSGDPIVTAKLVELKSMLISITTVVTSYINRYAAAKGPKYKTDAELWSLALSKIPLMGPSKLDEQTYNRRTQGLEIAGDFIKLILDIATSEGPALNSFKSFLEGQGNALRAGIEKNTDAYKAIIIGISVEVLKIGDQIVYIPKIKKYQVNFTRDNAKWSSSCASYEEISMEFDYVYGANVFDYEALNNPEIKKEFEKFISDQKKAKIEDASTFFNDDFETK
ncbi:hypothetical protein [uncultured Gammaproteobacteria bacterium]|nr:hypothetical protein [uncultured Gammaproteobacteria bacterium]